jgi:hypothetical protein
LTTGLPVDDTAAERDDLDIIFEDIAAMVLPRRYYINTFFYSRVKFTKAQNRYDDEIADFAQNLGFLSNDLNFDSMAFQGTQGGS